MENFESQNSVFIESPTVNDAEGIQNVYYETWLDTYPNEQHGITIEDIEHKLKDYLSSDLIEKRRNSLESIPENESIFIAKEKERVIGVCRVVRNDDDNRLKSIYVLPNFQGKGIGNKLWNQAKLTFDENKPIYVSLADYNEKAKNFYKKLGFVDTGKRWINERNRMKSGSVITEIDMVLDR